MKLLKLLTLVGLISTILPLTAQNPKQANIWYFGTNAGLDFTNGNPVPLTNGAMSAAEGVTVACDENGSLLFYSNGGNLPNTGAIWNRNHQVMLNGALSNTSGCASSIQSSLAVKRPGSSNIFYMFTTDCVENGLENGLGYSIIDMNLDGGLGGVIAKGIKLNSKANESLAAVKHANGRDYWIITHTANTDSFYVYHLTNNGILGVVGSKSGLVANQYAGEIKVSSNGERLVFAATSFTGLFDFNNETGIVSNFRDLGVQGFTACFSPDCHLLYVVDFVNRKMYQYSMLANNIRSTRIQVASTSNYIGSIQLGPDDKIYAAMRNSQYLAVITRPNIKGVNCNFVEQGVYLGGKISKYGLPNYSNDILGECIAYPKENVSNYDIQFQYRQSMDEDFVAWNTFSEANEYHISIRRPGDEYWQTITSSSNSMSFSAYDENSTYDVRMESIQFENAQYTFIYEHQFDKVTSGLNENSEHFQITTSTRLKLNLFPNPVRDRVFIEFDLKNQLSPVSVNISDMSGKLVYHQKWDALSGSQKIDLKFNLPEGIYNLTLIRDSASENKKLVIMN